MQIGLIIAIEREMKAFLANGRDITCRETHHRKVYSCRIGNHTVYAICSGCGEIDAAAATQLLISEFCCDPILNFGVAGALEPGWKVEDLFIVSRACNHDFDTSPVDPVKKHQYVDFPDEFIPLDGTLLKMAKTVCPSLVEATVASGERFVEEREDKIGLNRLGCQICDMEIAAIARVSFLNGVRCLSVKCISDTFEGDGGDFQTNVTKSAEKAFAVLVTIIENL